MTRHLFCLFVGTAQVLTWLGGTTTAWAQQSSRDYGPHMGYGGHMWEGGWMGWFFGPLMMIVFLFAAIVLIVLVVRWLGGTGHGAAHHMPPTKTPLDILKERFARGEIDKDEFEERRRYLE
jgi:putative membrane protein